MKRFNPRLSVVLAAFVAASALTIHFVQREPVKVAASAPSLAVPTSAAVPDAPVAKLPPEIALASADASALVAPPTAVPLFNSPAPSIGQRIDSRSSQYIQAKLGGKKPVGRVAQVDRASVAKLAGFHEGDRVTIPLMDGEQVEGVVNVVQAGTGGWVRVGGELSGARAGSFFVATNGSAVGGLIQLPREKLAFEIVEERDGRTVMQEKVRGDVVCDPLPPMENEPKLAPAEGPVSAVPVLNSRPNAVEVIYLDFDGETVTDPSWNNGKTIVAASFNLSNATITQIFDRVKDDWWPFNVNVTTEVSRYNSAAVGHRMRVIITPTNTAAPGAGGVAYLYSFSRAGSSYSDTIPCWVFNSSAIGISEAISHEVGHTMGLSHDGREIPGTGHEEYFQGYGTGATSWCPIMGAGYYVNVVQWSKGEYQYANNQEDDLAMISANYNHFGYASDQAGNTRTSAAPLSGNPSNGQINQAGVIERTADVDFFQFSTNGGNATITATPTSPSPDLDIVLEIQDSTGAVVATNNPVGSLNAALTNVSLGAGLYYVKVSNTGVGNGVTVGYSTYASIGAYTLTGTIVGLTNNPIINSSLSALGQVGTFFTYSISASGNPVTFGVIGTLPNGLTVNTSTGLISGFPTETGTFVVQITAQNASGTGAAQLTISISPPTFTIAQAVDFEALTWTTGGDVPWSAQTLVSFDGTDAAQAGDLSDDQSGYLQTGVTGPTKVNFRWKVSSELDNDFLVFQIDGVDVPLLSISGEVDWTLVTGIDIPAGFHQLRWVYRKNATLSDGKDTAWVDTVSFTSPQAPVITSIISTSGTVGVPFNFQLAATNVPGSFALDAGTLPIGLSLNPATGRITGVPAIAGNKLVTVSATNNIGKGTQDLTIAIAPSTITVAEALDNTAATWVLGGDANWFPEIADSYFGGSALQAGPIGNSQATFVTTTTNSAAQKTVNFYWKAQCEPGGDRLRFLVDDVQQALIDGFTDWQNKSIVIDPGSHTLKWVYEKDATTSLGADTAYLDKVVITDDLLPVILSGDQVLGQVGTNLNFQITASNQPDFYSADGLPAGLTLDPDTGVISGIPAASGTFPVVFGATNDAGTGTKVVSFKISPAPTTIGDAVDAPQFVWTTGGDAPWFAQLTETFDLVDAAQSGPISNSQLSFLETHITGPIAVTFRCKVESENGKDYLRFFIDGTFQTRISGSTGWQQLTFPVGPGDHTLRWEYLKDSSVATGRDAAWVDTVSTSSVSTSPAITSQLQAPAYLGRNFRYQVTATNSPTLFKATGLPANLSINPTTGLISGIPLTAGQVNVTIEADNANSQGVPVTLVLDVQDEPPGADLFANASSIGGVFILSEGTNLFAGGEAGEPTHAGQAATASVWWSWTAPLTGEVRVDTNGSAIDTLLSVYTGSALNALTVVRENDDATGSVVYSSVKFPAVAGQTYLIAVDGLNGGTGRIQLNLGYTATGGYNGLVEDPTDVAAPGLATLTLSNKFAFSGSIQLEGKKYSVKGSFVGEDYKGQIKRAKGLTPLDLALHLNLSPGAEEITGTVTDGALSYVFTAQHAMMKADVPADVQGAFTFSLEPDVVAPEVPAGFGFGTVKIDKSGKVTAVGTLGDGTKFSVSAPLATDKTWIFYATPYKPGGVVAGQMVVQPGAIVFAPISGPLVWRRALDAKAKLYSGGFATGAKLQGYPYVKPAKGIPILNVIAGPNNLNVAFTGGDVAPQPTNFAATLDTASKLTGAPDGFKLTFTLSSGLFSGSLTDGSGKARKINGAVLQGTVNNGVGQFIGTTKTGAIQLTPTK